MTTDPTALQERIAEELYYDQHPEGRHRGEWPAAVYPDTVHEHRDLAATVLPIVEVEVRAYLTERCTTCGEDPSGPLRPLTADERSYRYAQDLGYELPEEPR